MINIQNEPSSFHPAYNNSYIQFDTSFVSDDRAVITLDGVYQFTLFPDTTGKYLFNMREVIKALINESQFKDTLITSSSQWMYPDGSMYRQLPVDVTVYGDNTSETLSKSYSFTKAVKQYGDDLFDNPNQLMIPSKDGINYNLTYFEGYPMDFSIRYVLNNQTISLKNKRTEQSTNLYTATVSNPHRIILDKGDTNLHSSGVLDIPDTINDIDVLIDGAPKSSIKIKKETAKCGKYLKWFNADGSYSYWLFNEWFKQEHTGKEIDRINTNNFSNIYNNQEGLNRITGKSGDSSIKLKTQVDENGKNHLISLMTSPFVQLWSEDTPYQSGKWLNVKLVSKGFTYVNKKRINQLEVDIELPEVNTQTL